MRVPIESIGGMTHCHSWAIMMPQERITDCQDSSQKNLIDERIDGHEAVPRGRTLGWLVYKYQDFPLTEFRDMDSQSRVSIQACRRRPANSWIEGEHR